VPFSFESLDVFEKAVSFSAAALDVTKKFPDSCSVLRHELDRAAISVCSDIACGSSIWAKNAKKQSFLDARGSCYRCAAFVQLGKTLGVVKDSDLAGMNEQIETIAKMLTKLAQSVDK
jgi:four helix bundle protein